MTEAKRVKEDDLSEEQRIAVKTSRENTLVLLTGPPGSGKSKTIKAMCGADTVLVGSTANAVDVLFRSTGVRGVVLDKLLHAKDVGKDKGRRFIIDEGGIVSTEKLCEFITHVKPGGLTIVGDPHQLPCVDGFPVLATLMRVPGVHHVKLTKSFRRDVSDKRSLDRAIETLGTGNFVMSDQDETFRIVVHESIQKCCEAAVEEYKEKPCQILAYVGKYADAINAATEDESREIIRAPTRDGDRVVCTKNLYFKNKPEPLVANGVCGTAVKGEGIKYDNGFVDSTLNSQFTPCRCITVHKSQGSEYDVHGVVVVCPWKGDPPISLLFTAISRFRKSVTVHVPRNMVSRVFNAKFVDVVDEKLIEEISGME